MKLPTVDFRNLFSEALLYSVPHDGTSLNTIKNRHQEWTADTARGTIHSGYRRQILKQEGLTESLKLAQQLRSSFDNMIVLGIGGSALGARMALSALLWKTPFEQRRKVLILDNLDPIDYLEQVHALNLKKTCVALVTKSGGTIETMAQAADLLGRFEKAGLSVRDHFIAVTDPSSGSLRKWTQQESLANLSLASDVGGRFSVFTPVGLLPLAFAGVDVEKLCSGAIEQFQNPEALESLTRLGSRLAELERAGFSGMVMFPYATLLKELGAWFVQLWGESLGKVSWKGPSRGSLPVAAVGATDQHSLLQMLVEGPNHMVTSFIRVVDWKHSLKNSSYSLLPHMHALPEAFQSLSFAYGKSFGDILNAECLATASVLEEKKRPHFEVALELLDEKNIGALLALFMDLVVCTAAASDVNPFDQPGVELGKKRLPGYLETQK